MKIAIVDDEAYWREKAEECIKEEMKNSLQCMTIQYPIWNLRMNMIYL